ncbi:hypothetical protein [Croceimicrobium sp.]|uniref:hypothetical protein n=1 Tax=Croceimicrobium sp. TaxID=2828340 RepID=UPI003BA8C699
MKKTFLILLALFSLSFGIANYHEYKELPGKTEQGIKVRFEHFENGAATIFSEREVYDNQIDPKVIYYEGLYFRKNEDGSGEYGFMTTAVVPNEYRTSPALINDTIRNVKEGKWYYFNSTGYVDSIVQYGNYLGTSLTVDTGYSELGDFYFVDSIYKDMYSSQSTIYNKE